MYLDDFLLIERTKERCILARDTLIALLRLLGFDIAWDKVEGPSQSLVFLGVQIDTVHDLLVLPEYKLSDFELLIDSMLSASRITFKSLQALAGKLNWASSVVRGGRVYLRRILDLMKPLKQARHKVRVSQGMKQDLLWWKQFLRTFNGKCTLDYTGECHVVYVDACEVGGACYFKGDWAYVNWREDYPQLMNAHINVKEGMMILAAALRWGQWWKNSKVICRVDNMTAVSAVNKGSSNSKGLMQVLRPLFWLSVCQNFHVVCYYLPGVNNVLADALSRLHEPVRFEFVANVFRWNDTMFNMFWPLWMVQHGSYRTFLFLVPQVLRWLNSGRNGVNQLGCIGPWHGR